VVRRPAAARARPTRGRATPPQPQPARDDRPAPLGLPLTVRAGGLALHLQPAPTAVLWAAYAACDWAGLLPGLAPAGQRLAVWQRIYDLDDEWDLPELAGCARRVGGALAGIDWWGACRIAATCDAHRFLWTEWQVRHQLEPAGSTLPRLLAGGYAFLVDRHGDREKLDKLVWATAPQGAPRTPRWTPDQEAQTFAAAMAAQATRRQPPAPVR
jgi:hypothetical protein